MRNAGLDESQAGIEISGRNINNLSYADNQKNEDHGTWPYHSIGNRWRNKGNSDRFHLSWASNSMQMVTASMKLKNACSLAKKLQQT